MVSSTETRLLELQTELWKARAQAKQKWLERSLAEPANTPEKAAQRLTWIKRTLKAVKRKQAEIKYQTLLMDAYAAHLSAIEMTLISAAEEKTQAGDPNAANDRALAGRRYVNLFRLQFDTSC